MKEKVAAPEPWFDSGNPERSCAGDERRRKASQGQSELYETLSQGSQPQ
jgi:hypothetical protein